VTKVARVSVARCTAQQRTLAVALLCYPSASLSSTNLGFRFDASAPAPTNSAHARRYSTYMRACSLSSVRATAPVNDLAADICQGRLHLYDQDYPLASTATTAFPALQATHRALRDLEQALLAARAYDPDVSGYTLRGAPGTCTTLHSTGFSDDTASLCSSWSHAEAQHAWLLDWFTAHHLRLNAGKTYCVVGSGRGVTEGEALVPLHHQPRRLPDIDNALVHDPGNGAPLSPAILEGSLPSLPLTISTRPPSFAMRFLGFMLRVDMASCDMEQVLNARVWAGCHAIRRNKLTLVQAADYVREYLYPRLELGLIFAKIPKSTMTRWDMLIRQACLSSCYGCNVSAVNGHAVRLALGVLPLSRHTVVLRGVELGNMLRGDDCQHTATAWCRLHAGTKSKHITLQDFTEGGRKMHAITAAGACKVNRLTGTIQHLLLAQVRVTIPATPHASPPPLTFAPDAQCVFDSRTGCPLLPTSMASFAGTTLSPPTPEVTTICAFTDGSFSSAGRSGFAVLLCNETALEDPNFDYTPEWCHIIQGGSPLAGANYTAECCPILIALRMVPVNCHLRLITDAKAVIAPITAPLLPVGRRLRLGCRPVMKTIRRYFDARTREGATTTFTHVHSHTESDDILSRGNAAADLHADLAANDATHTADRETPFLHGEERAIFWNIVPDVGEGERYTHISGALRPILHKAGQRHELRCWKLRGHSGQQRIVSKYGPQLITLLDRVRRTRDAELLLFALLACTRQLATADKLIWPVLARTTTDRRCRRCLLEDGNTMDHVFRCPAVRATVRTARELVATDVRCLVAAPIATPGLHPQHVALLRRAPEELEWYDPNRAPVCVDFLGEHAPDPAVRRAASAANAHDREAGLLGLFPCGLTTLLCPDPTQCGLRERDHRRLRAGYTRDLATLQLTVLRGSQAIYNTWRQQPTSFGWRRPPARLPACPTTPTCTPVVGLDSDEAKHDAPPKDTGSELEVCDESREPAPVAVPVPRPTDPGPHTTGRRVPRARRVLFRS
jgi:hypothetical protein